MAECYRCGASIEFVEYEGRRFAIDTYESYGGPGRWSFNKDGEVEPVDRYADAAGHPEHKTTCMSGASPGDRIGPP